MQQRMAILGYVFIIAGRMPFSSQVLIKSPLIKACHPLVTRSLLLLLPHRIKSDYLSYVYQVLGGASLNIRPISLLGDIHRIL